MSLPYFETFGWQVEVVAVDSKYYETNLDQMLLQSIPADIKIHYVNAFEKKYTSKLGLGSLALRSLWFYRKKVNQLLKEKHFDLIYFSTTQFPVCILGAYWKNKFGIPYVIDLQDPWHTTYYLDKPKNERPPKYWFAYRINKYLEPIAFKKVDGLIAVSQKYLNDVNGRYSQLNKNNQRVITFGYSSIDLKIANGLALQPNSKKTLCYIGVLGPMMNKSLDLFFRNLSPKLINEYQIVFKGTSYANAEKAKKSTTSFKEKYNLTNLTENTNRLGMFEVLKELMLATGLLIIGTDDSGYTASKIYPYLQTGKPILAVLHPKSNANEILANCSNAIVINLDDEDKTVKNKLEFFAQMIEDNAYTVTQHQLHKYSAEEMTKKQCELFAQIIDRKISVN